MAAAQPASDERRYGSLLGYLLLLVSMQVFLMVAALEGVLGHDFALARNAAVLSVAVFGAVAGIRWFVGPA